MPEEYRPQGQQTHGYTPEAYEEEISLRELIEALLKHWKKIAAITLAALVVAAVVTLGFITPVYEARVIISLNQPDRYTSQAELQELLAHRLTLTTFDDRGEMSIRNAEMFINSPEVVEAAMTAQAFEEWPIDRLMETICVEALNPTVFHVAVQGPKQHQLLGLADEIAVQFNRVSNSEITRILQQEISRRERAIRGTEENLAANRAQLEATPLFITLERAVLDDPSMAIADPDAGRGALVRTQETNPSYLARLEVVTQSEMELNRQQIELVETKHEIEQILEQLHQPENAPVRVVRAAAESMDDNPIKKVSPRTSLNLAIALVLGLMVGVFTAFFIEYWQKSKPQEIKP